MISPGDKVWAKDAFGELLPRVAITGPVRGHDFVVVWVTTELAWDAACSAREADPSGTPWPPEGVPWPVEDVELREDDL